MDYDKIYQKTAHIFGLQPERILSEYLPRINPSKPILDIGVGQGRNALFLAQKGFNVYGIDPSTTAIKSVKESARMQNLTLKLSICSFESFIAVEKGFSAILVFVLIPILRIEQIRLLKEKILDWTDKNSLIFITAFTTADPAFDQVSREYKQIDRNSFQKEEGSLRTYLENGELLELFNECETLHYRESMGPLHRHGGSPPEQHALAEAVFMKIG